MSNTPYLTYGVFDNAAMQSRKCMAAVLVLVPIELSGTGVKKAELPAEEVPVSAYGGC